MLTAPFYCILSARRFAGNDQSCDIFQNATNTGTYQFMVINKQRPAVVNEAPFVPTATVSAAR